MDEQRPESHDDIDAPDLDEPDLTELATDVDVVDRLEVSHLADEDHVRVLPER